MEHYERLSDAAEKAYARMGSTMQDDAEEYMRRYIDDMFEFINNYIVMQDGKDGSESFSFMIKPTGPFSSKPTESLFSMIEPAEQLLPEIKTDYRAHLDYEAAVNHLWKLDDYLRKSFDTLVFNGDRLAEKLEESVKEKKGWTSAHEEQWKALTANMNEEYKNKIYMAANYNEEEGISVEDGVHENTVYQVFINLWYKGLKDDDQEFEEEDEEEDDLKNDKEDLQVIAATIANIYENGPVFNFACDECFPLEDAIRALGESDDYPVEDGEFYGNLFRNPRDLDDFTRAAKLLIDFHRDIVAFALREFVPNVVVEPLDNDRIQNIVAKFNMFPNKIKRFETY